MIINVINKKGGVGKTPLSFCLARSLDYNIISNDTSIIESIYPKRAKVILKDDIPLNDNTVYDFGGFTDGRALNIIRSSDFIIIPTINSLNSLTRSIETLDDIADYVKDDAKVIIVGTRLDKPDEINEIKENIDKYFEGLEYFPLSRSKIFDRTIESGKSIEEYVNNPMMPGLKYIYRNIIRQYNELLSVIKGNLV